MEDLDIFVPYQPLTAGLQFTRRTMTAGLLPVDEAPYIRFIFGLLSESQYQAMLTQASILVALRREVTLYAQNRNYEWVRFNGTAIKPENEGRRGYFLNNVPLLVIGIHDAA
jgi:hypothetical protein